MPTRTGCRADLGTLPPIVKPKGIDDVPVLAVTLWSRDGTSGAELERVAHTHGGRAQARARRARGADHRRPRPRGAGDARPRPAARARRRRAAPAGRRWPPPTRPCRPAPCSTNNGRRRTHAERRDRRVPALGRRRRRPGRRRAPGQAGATCAKWRASRTAPRSRARYVWFTPGAAAQASASAAAGQVHPAVTLTVTKKPGQNAVDVARAARARVDELRNTVIPPGIEATITRDYGETAAEKANKLIQKLAFATGSVILLVGPGAGPARGGDRRRGGDPDAHRHAVRLLGLGLHAQPRVAVRADLLDRHPGRRRDRGGGEHPPPPAAGPRHAARARSSRPRWTRSAARPSWPR